MERLRRLRWRLLFRPFQIRHERGGQSACFFRARREEFVIDLAEKNFASGPQLEKCRASANKVSPVAGVYLGAFGHLVCYRFTLRKKARQRTAAVEHALGIPEEVCLHSIARFGRFYELIDF